MNRNVVIFLLAGLVAADAAEPAPLSLQDAQERAIRNHPRISEADLLALASEQVVREVRSAYYPTITADATAVGALGSNTRIAAGGLNNPLILDRDAEGATVNQIITDFGRTINLSASAKLNAQAQRQSALATREEILLEVNSAYFGALRAQAVLSVAEQTVATRQATYDQVATMATNQLRSQLQADFAKVDLQRGQLLLVSASNDLSAAFARLTDVLGERSVTNYQLVDLSATPAPVPAYEQLIGTALQDRPDLAQLRLEKEAADRFARAEKDLNYPTISAVGAAGVIPVHDPLLKDNYAAAGVNLSLPIFDGFLFSARKQEADLKASAAEEKTREAEDNIVRDVRVAAMNVSLAAQNIDLTAQLLQTAGDEYDLADANFRAGLGDIVQLSLAQLGKTQAQIDAANAKYDYLLQNSILDFQIGVMH